MAAGASSHRRRCGTVPKNTHINNPPGGCKRVGAIRYLTGIEIVSRRQIVRGSNHVYDGHLVSRGARHAHPGRRQSRGALRPADAVPEDPVGYAAGGVRDRPPGGRDVAGREPVRAVLRGGQPAEGRTCRPSRVRAGCCAASCSSCALPRRRPPMPPRSWPPGAYAGSELRLRRRPLRRRRPRRQQASRSSN